MLFYFILATVELINESEAVNMVSGAGDTIVNWLSTHTRTNKK